MLNSLPLVTVIMAVRNEAAFIKRSLGSVLEQDYPSDLLEVIVADGQSTDGTREIVRSIQDQRPDIKLIDNPAQIVAAGLNAALRQARGEFIVRVDGHTVIAPDYVQQCVCVLHRTGADNAGGKMIAIGVGVFAKAVAIATSSPFGVGGARFHFSNDEEWVDTVYLGAWRREVFARIGLFDEELVRNQDDELNYRLRDRGGKIRLSPAIKSEYTVRSTPRALWRQYFQYGLWKVRVLQKHPRQMQLRQFVPLLFTAALLGSALLATFARPGRALLALVAGGYTLLNLGASVRLASRYGWDNLRLLPLVFSILHVGYGLGFLVGLVRFIRRWGDSRRAAPHLVV